MSHKVPTRVSGEKKYIHRYRRQENSERDLLEKPEGSHHSSLPENIPKITPPYHKTFHFFIRQASLLIIFLALLFRQGFLRQNLVALSLHAKRERPILPWNKKLPPPRKPPGLALPAPSLLLGEHSEPAIFLPLLLLQHLQVNTPDFPFIF